MTSLPNDDLQGALDSIGSVINTKPHDYESWRVRGMLLEKLGIGSKDHELKFAEEILLVDPKNKYSWFHRKCVFEAFGGGENEIAFTEKFLEADVCNEYAWDQRIFVVTRYNREAASDEIEYVLRAILMYPENEFSWKNLCYLHEEFWVDATKLDELFESVLAKDNSDQIINRGWREESLNEIQIYIVTNRKMLVNALDALLDLICSGYVPSYSIRCEIMARDPTVEYKNEFLESTCSILKFACPLRDNHWEWRVDYARKVLRI